MQELIDVEGDGMADMVFRCIQEMDIDNRMMVFMFFLSTRSPPWDASCLRQLFMELEFVFLFYFGSSTNTLSWVVGAQCILDYLVGKYVISLSNSMALTIISQYSNISQFVYLKNYVFVTSLTHFSLKKLSYLT